MNHQPDERKFFQLKEDFLKAIDPMSPILWNIFYDEILTHIQSKIGNKLNNTINISVLAYADDIKHKLPPTTKHD